jgi:hypothetical protein
MVNTDRKSEKRGWLLGWFGSFLWILILAIVALAKGSILPSLAGCGLVAGAVTAILLFAPWRHPTQRYWKLMLPIYALFFISVGWAIWIAGGVAELGLSLWSIFLLLPLLLPFYLAGNRRWIDGEHSTT